jgi:TPR repeat protein
MLLQKLCVFAIIPLSIIHAGEQISYASIVKGHRKTDRPAPQPLCKPQIVPSSSIEPTFNPHALLNQIAATPDAHMRNTLAVQLTETPCPQTMDGQAFVRICAKGWKRTAEAYKQHEDPVGLLISLCNMFVVRYHVDLPQKSSTVKQLCELLATGSVRHYETVYKDEIQNDQDVLPELINEGQKLHLPHATYLHARALYEKNDIDGALAALASLDIELAVDLCRKTENDGLALLFCNNEFKRQSGEKKWLASWLVYRLLHTIAPTRADVHLHLAASNGCPPAMKEAYIRGNEESDPAKALKHFEQAAKGGHTNAHEKCAEHYYDQLATITSKEEKARTQALIEMHLKAAAAKNPRALIKLAFLPEDLLTVVSNLRALTTNQSFPLKGEAYRFLGDTYYKVGISLGDLKLRQEYLSKAETAYKNALAKKEKSALRSLALLAVDQLTVINQKSLKNAIITAKRLLHTELEKTPNDGELLCALGNIELKYNDLAIGQTLILRAFKANPKSPETHTYIKDIFTWLADQEHFDRVKELAEGLLEIDPSYAASYLFLGSLYQHHNPELACVYFQIAAELGSAGGHHALSTIYLDENGSGTLDLDKALFHAEQAHKLKPLNTEIIYRLAQVHIALGQEDLAIITLAKGIKMKNPDCCALLAKYRHENTLIPDLLKQASLLYARASDLISNYTQKSIFKNLSNIIRLQIPIPSNKEAIETLNDIIREPGYAALKTEALLALAIQLNYNANIEQDITKRKASYLESLSHLEMFSQSIPNDARALFLRAKTIHTMLINKMLDPSNDVEAQLISQIQPLFHSAINLLEERKAAQSLLISCYNALGTYFVESTDTKEAAEALFISGALLNSTESCLKLHTYYLSQNNPGQALLWLNRARGIDPIIHLELIENDMDVSSQSESIAASSVAE